MNFRPKKPAARIVPKPFGLINSVSLRSPKQSSTFPWCLIKTRLCKQVKYANSKTNMKTNHTLFPIVFKNLLFLYKLKLKITLSFIRSTHNKKGSTTPRHSQHQSTNNTKALTTPSHSQHQSTHNTKALTAKRRKNDHCYAIELFNQTKWKNCTKKRAYLQFPADDVI